MACWMNCRACARWPPLSVLRLVELAARLAQRHHRLRHMRLVFGTGYDFVDGLGRGGALRGADLGRVRSGELDAGVDRVDCLLNNADRLLAMPAFVGRGRLRLCFRLREGRKRRLHLRLTIVSGHGSKLLLRGRRR